MIKIRTNPSKGEAIQTGKKMSEANQIKKANRTNSEHSTTPTCGCCAPDGLRTVLAGAGGWLCRGLEEVL
jgi:hypothetical protein